MLRGRRLFAALLVVQLICAIVFLFDIVALLLNLPVPPLEWQMREIIEILAALGLVLGVVGSTVALSSAQRRTERAEQSLRAANGAFIELLEDRFERWALTPAERDVALFAIKGMSTAEIASLRSTSEGTVKAQTNAIYRKAGVSGRPQLLSIFIDDLMAEPLLPAPEGSAGPRERSAVGG